MRRGNLISGRDGAKPARLLEKRFSRGRYHRPTQNESSFPWVKKALQKLNPTNLMVGPPVYVFTSADEPLLAKLNSVEVNILIGGRKISMLPKLIIVALSAAL